MEVSPAPQRCHVQTWGISDRPGSKRPNSPLSVGMGGLKLKREASADCVAGPSQPRSQTKAVPLVQVEVSAWNTSSRSAQSTRCPAYCRRAHRAVAPDLWAESKSEECVRMADRGHMRSFTGVCQAWVSGGGARSLRLIREEEAPGWPASTAMKPALKQPAVPHSCINCPPASIIHESIPTRADPY